jgi:hypothetical protein
VTQHGFKAFDLGTVEAANGEPAWELTDPAWEGYDL